MFSSNTSSFGLARAEVVFTVSGSWVVPVGVTTVSALCVGAGGGGSESASGGSGGGGGDLRYNNNLPVTAGETLTITTGLGGTPGTTGTAGAFSRIARGATVLLEAAGGGGGTISGSGAKNGTSTTIAGSVGGGNGGTSPNPSTTTCGGGGGAGGYSGNGGNGSDTASSGNNGAGGGGGGGGGGGDGDRAGPGGGVSAFGLGPNGIGGEGNTANGFSATGGSYGDGGLDENSISSGDEIINSYGGGGGGADNTTEAGAGGNGFVRIIWPGTSCSFPSTNVWMSEVVTGVIETQSQTSGVITIPLAALPGDLAVLSNMSETVGVQSNPAGWTRIVNQEAAVPMMTVWYRILQAGDAGTTVTMTGGTAPSSEMILLRKASGVVSSVTVSGSTIAQSTGLITDQTQTVSGAGVSTSVVFGVFAHNDPASASFDMTFTGGVAGSSNSEPSVVFTGANGDNTRQLFMRFRIYDTPPASPVVVKNNRDVGSQTMASFILGVN